MSSHLEVYIGVYLVVDQWVESTYTKRVCQEDHPQRTYSHAEPVNFCNICGTKVSEKKFESKERINLNDAEEIFDIDIDTFIHIDQGDNPPIWISNLTDDNLVRDDATEREITPEYIEDAVVLFKQNYAEELRALDDNDVDYKMHFGFVPYYN